MRPWEFGDGIWGHDEDEVSCLVDIIEEMLEVVELSFLGIWQRFDNSLMGCLMSPLSWDIRKSLPTAVLRVSDSLCRVWPDPLWGPSESWHDLWWLLMCLYSPKIVKNFSKTYSDLTWPSLLDDSAVELSQVIRSETLASSSLERSLRGTGSYTSWAELLREMSSFLMASLTSFSEKPWRSPWYHSWSLRSCFFLIAIDWLLIDFKDSLLERFDHVDLELWWGLLSSDSSSDLLRLR